MGCRFSQNVFLENMTRKLIAAFLSMSHWNIKNIIGIMPTVLFFFFRFLLLFFCLKTFIKMMPFMPQSYILIDVLQWHLLDYSNGKICRFCEWDFSVITFLMIILVDLALFYWYKDRGFVIFGKTINLEKNKFHLALNILKFKITILIISPEEAIFFEYLIVKGNHLNSKSFSQYRNYFF